jgi:hypothetical protein
VVTSIGNAAHYGDRMLVVLSGQEGQERDQARGADPDRRSPDAAARRWLLDRLVLYRSQYRQRDSSKAVCRKCISEYR